MIGTGLAILGSAAIGAGANAIAGNKAAKAAKKAATANNQLLEAAQNRAYSAIDPYLQGGYQANNALLNIVGGGYAAGKTGGPAPGSTDWNGYLAQNPDAAEWVQGKIAQQGGTPEQWAQQHYTLDAQARGEARALPTVATPEPQPQTNGNPTYGPQIAPRPVMTRPTAPALDVSLGSYEKSPDYEFQLSEGNRNILTNKGSMGQLESGAAMKAIQKYGQDVAYGDYGKWRDYTTGQRNFEAGRGDANFNVDSTRSDAQYDSDRGYLTGRFDTQINDLFRIAGQGASAVGTAIGVGQNTVQGMAANNNSAATVQGNAALSGANNVNQLLGAALNMYGQMNVPVNGGGYTYVPPKPTNYAVKATA